jgi:LacI family transcriptional regulator
MRITQKTIARDLGVSFMTVSRVFNNSGYVSKELRKRILDYAKKNRYEPHRASQVLVRNTIRNIAVFSSTFPEYFWEDIEKGILQAAEQIKFFNYEVHYHRVPDFDSKKYCSLLSREIKNGLDAAAFVCQDIFDMNSIIGMVEKENIPYLLYNVDAADTGRLCYIGADYRSGGRLAANFIGKALELKQAGRALAVNFIRNNHRFPAMPDINAERLEGFLSVMKEHFSGVSCAVEQVDTKTSVERQIMQILKKYRTKTDAIYFMPAYNDVYHQALKRYDFHHIITLQHDIDDSALSCLESDLLTAVIFQDPILQGYTVVRTLETILESKCRERLKDIEIAHNLVLRENSNFLQNHYLKPKVVKQPP